MGALPKTVFTSPEEYLFYENDRADHAEKCEYINGQVYTMAGASRNHNRICMNIATSLFNHLKGSRCQVFQSDMKVAIQTLNDTRFYYPDVQVTCEEETDNHYNTAPCLIIEVLSNSTARTDGAPVDAAVIGHERLHVRDGAVAADEREHRNGSKEGFFHWGFLQM